VSTPISNIRWVAISQIARVSIQLVSISVFSRLLPPSDFGVLAMATVIINFANLFRDMGTSAALINAAELSAELLNTVFWSNVAFGLILAALTAGTAPLMAATFKEPLLRDILLLLSLTFPVTALGLVQQALLERRSAFRTLAVAEIISAVVAFAIALFVAFRGGGIYSLIVQGLTATVLLVVQLCILERWRPAFEWKSAEFRTIWRFSSHLVGFNLINYFTRNADNILVGRFLGSTELGYYNMAYRIMLFPVQNLTYVLARALFPIYSRQHRESIKLQQQYLKTVSLIAAISGPLMFGLWATRDVFVELFLGSKWLPASDIIAWLAPTGFLQSIGSATGVVLMAIGRTDILRKTGLIGSVVIIGAIGLGLHLGSVGVAKYYFLANIFSMLIAVDAALKAISIKPTTFIGALWRPTLATLAMSVAVMASDKLIFAPLTPLLRAPALVLTGFAIYFSLLYAFASSLLLDLRRAIWR
jgi:PST family polysaccharide transporter